MVKHLVKHGNSYAVIIDKAVLELIKADSDTAFDVISDGRSLVLTPIRDAATEKKFDAALDRLHKRFGNAMRKLAE